MKKAVVMFLLLSLLVMSNAVYAVDILPGGLPAFPGAEGGGMYTTGARAVPIPEIYHVENQSVIFCGQFNTCLSVSLPAPAFRFRSLNLSYPFPALWAIL